MAAIRPTGFAPRALRVGLMVWLTLGSGVALAPDAEVNTEYRVKAAFLYNFTRYIEWPAGSFSAPGSPIVIGLLCPATFTTQLRETVSRRKVNGRAIVVKTLDQPASARSVHLVFVCRMMDTRAQQLIGLTATVAVVTVGESANFAEAGGMVNFVLVAGKVRFAINNGAAQRAGLKISAQLQKLAIVASQAP